MATLEDLRIANWAKPENKAFCLELAVTVDELEAAAKRGVVGAVRAAYLAEQLRYAARVNWPNDARWWLREYREEIDSLLRAKTPAQLIEEA